MDAKKEISCWIQRRIFTSVFTWLLWRCGELELIIDSVSKRRLKTYLFTWSIHRKRKGVASSRNGGPGMITPENLENFVCKMWHLGGKIALCLIPNIVQFWPKRLTFSVSASPRFSWRNRRVTLHTLLCSARVW